MLRYDSPVQLTARTATEDVEVGGQLIPAGRPVIAFIGGANRDPEVFEQPDEFRIDRPDPGRHLSFSLGLHHCLGAVLARLEGRIAFEELTRRYPALELTAPPTRRSLLVFRGFERVPVRARAIRSESAA
jgi:cytochrome P450